MYVWTQKNDTTQCELAVLGECIHKACAVMSKAAGVAGSKVFTRNNRMMTARDNSPAALRRQQARRMRSASSGAGGEVSSPLLDFVQRSGAANSAWPMAEGSFGQRDQLS